MSSELSRRRHDAPWSDGLSKTTIPCDKNCLRQSSEKRDQVLISDNTKAMEPVNMASTTRLVGESAAPVSRPLTMTFVSMTANRVTGARAAERQTCDARRLA